MKLSNILLLMVFILFLTHDARSVSLTGDAASTSLVEIIAVEAVLTNDAGKANLTDYIEVRRLQHHQQIKAHGK
jgi:competence protein ComGC